MSGPKVVRVVTREELVAEGEALLSRLNQAVSALSEVVGASDEASMSTVSRRDHLERLLRADRFAEFTQAATAEIGFLSAETTRRREAIAQALAAQQARSVSGKAIAKALLKAGNSNEGVRSRLEMAARGELPLEELDRVLSEALQNASDSRGQSSALTKGQLELAARLAEGNVKTLDAWKAGVAKEDVRLREVLSDISELELLSDAQVASSARSALEEVLSEESEASRNMRMDSLQVSVRKSKQVARLKASSLMDVDHLKDELANKMPDAPSLSRLTAASMDLSLEELTAVLASGRSELAAAQSRLAAAARREAVLDGLAKLGYTLQEGLGTVAVEGGGLVVKSPNRPGYGVQVTGAGDMSRMQVRTVAFDKHRDVAQDRAEEESWCGDFGELKALLATQGCQLVVEKALGVGATPLREILVEKKEDEGSFRVTTPNTKALR